MLKYSTISKSIQLIFVVVAALGIQNCLGQTSGTTPPSLITADKVQTQFGVLEYKDGAPSNATIQKVYDHLDFTHAFETFVNAYQGASTYALLQGMNQKGIANNTVLIFSELMDSKSLFLTANADVVYYFAILDASSGPIVLETPPLALGVIDDMWFNWITDFGLPGPDRGEGGKYLLVPPGYTGELPASGYIISKMRTKRALMLGRSFLENNDPKVPVAMIKKTLKIYPFQAGGLGTSIASALTGHGTLQRSPDGKLDWAFLKPQPPAKFVEGTGMDINTVPPNDYTFFQLIDKLVQEEPADALSPEIMGSLAAIGIVKGKTFNPDARMKKILTEAAAMGTATGRTLNWKPRQEEGFAYYSGTSTWINMLFLGGYNFETPPPAVSSTGVITQYPSSGYRMLNSRTSMFFYATGITPAMIMRLTEIGSQYLGAFTDSKGEYLDGGKTYKISLPKDIPAAKFWSFTVYDNQTRSMLQTPQRYPRAGSQSYPSPAAVADADGSVTVYFGPSKPAGVSDGNWIQTTSGKGWNVLLRLYSPLEPFFTKTWKPGEFILVK